MSTSASHTEIEVSGMESCPTTVALSWFRTLRQQLDDLRVQMTDIATKTTNLQDTVMRLQTNTQRMEIALAALTADVEYKRRGIMENFPTFT
jgi:hypothetical protein